jgi:AraC-like DNA-binding protein/mannose-6-phosphate isomerase-like protein (cupin superfamily)
MNSKIHKEAFYEFDAVRYRQHLENYPVLFMDIVEPEHLLHSHNFIEIVVVNSGYGKNVTEKGEQRLVPGDVFIIPRGIKHGYLNVENLNITNILFQMATVDNYFSDIKLMPGFFSFFIAEIAPKKMKMDIGHLLNLSSEELFYVKDLQKKIQEEQNTRRSGSVPACLCYLGQLLIYLCRLLEQRNKKTYASNTYNKLSKVYDFINKNFDEKISIEKLAEIAYMSPRNFQRIFTQMNKLSPTKYINKIRLENARAWLKNTSMEINQIAFKAGFQESSYFSSQFKKAFGISPRQYRNTVENRSK